MKAWKLRFDVELRPLLSYCLDQHRVDRLLLAHRQDEDGALRYPAARAVTEGIFGERIVEWRIGRQWPGSILYRGSCLLAVASFDEGLIEPMCAVASKLFEWTTWPAPVLPEDLCLYRQGAQWPSLVSVTHERDAWIVGPEKPGLIEAEEEEFVPEEFYIPPASQGFIS